ncbi:MAG: Pseudogene of Ig-like domain-containing protein [Methanobrevibacter sp. CfCl-M3]
MVLKMIENSKKIVIVGISCLFLSFLVLNSAQNTVTINPGNNSIQAAIDNATPGDTILLNGGTYNQHDINVTKNEFNH